jgi:hypothetical protein
MKNSVEPPAAKNTDDPEEPDEQKSTCHGLDDTRAQRFSARFTSGC